MTHPLQIFDLCLKILPTKSRTGLKFSIILITLLFISTLLSIAYALSTLNKFTIILFAISTILVGVFNGILLSILLTKLSTANFQLQSYRRKKRNSGKIFVKSEHGWFVYSHYNDLSLNTIAERLKQKGVEFEIGGYTPEQQKALNRVNKLKSIKND